MQKLKQKTGSGDIPPVDVLKPFKRKSAQISAFQKNGIQNESGKPKKQKSFAKNRQGSDGSNTDFKKKKMNSVDSNSSKKKAGLIMKTSEGSNEKPKWSEMKKEKKELRLKRRKAKITEDVFDKSAKAKMLAAQIQRKVTKPELKLHACTELHALLKGKYKTLALTHDLSRVIQVLLKYAPENIKTEITEELLEIMVQMAQSKYAHHTVRRILKYGNDFIRHEVIKKFYGNIVSLATHAISAPILDFAYGEFATKKEKLLMQQEFYGDIYKNTKDETLQCFADSYKYSPGLKSAILHASKSVIQKILDKNLHDGELFHTVLYDYLLECGAEERQELVSQLSGLVVPLANSLPGANAACMCVWYGTNKDKKMILKVVKEHAVSLSKHKTGYRLLLAIFDSVDDTVLVRKTVIAPILGELRTIVADHYGNMVIHWLVKPKDKVTFHPLLIRFLEEGAKNGTSKKDPKLRETELQEAVLPVIIEDILEQTELWLSSKSVMLLVVTVMSTRSSKELVDAVAQVICRAGWRVRAGAGEAVAVEDAGIHMCLKKMAALDAISQHTLAEAICNHLKDDAMELWLSSNRGCFFLLKLIQYNSNDHGKKLKNMIRPHLQMLKNQKFDGAKLLENEVV